MKQRFMDRAPVPRVATSLALACALAAFLRLPAFRYRLLSDDEAIYDAMAQVVVRGGTMYRDTVDHKPPGLVYTYSAVRALVDHVGGSFGDVMAAIHATGIVFVVLTCVALYFIAREVLEPRLACVPSFLYACTSAVAVPPDSLAVNGELLMNLPSALGVLFALRGARAPSPSARAGYAVLAGASVAVAALYKYQAGLVGLSFLFLLWPPRRDARDRASFALIASLLLLLGFAIPFMLVGLYFWERGAWDDALRWGLAFNVHYLAEGPDFATATSRLGMQLLGVVLPSAFVYGAAGMTLRDLAQAAPSERTGIRRAPWLLVVWTAGALYSVTLGRRFFGHYFLQLALPVCILAAAPVARALERRRATSLALLFAPVGVFFTIALLPEVFGRLVYASDPDYVQIGRAVAARSRPDDTIWVWGNVPQVYFTAERRPGVRFTFCNYLTGLSPGSRSESDPGYDSRKNAVPGGWDMVVHDLDAARPAVIIDTAAGAMKSYGKYPVSSFPVLASYLDEHYRKAGVVEGAVLYIRKGTPG
jgi:hypothetical protein